MTPSLGQFVSRETCERLDDLASEVLRWTKTINLIGKTTQSEIVQRHVIDSVGFWEASRPEARQHWVDLGSGGGFPGLVIAIIAADHDKEMRTTLVEADQRKSAFLRTMISRHGLKKCQVRNERIEVADPLDATVVSARALAPLDKLLEYVSRHIADNGTALLGKGAKADEEIKFARQNWSFQLHARPSIVDTASTILEIRDIQAIHD